MSHLLLQSRENHIRTKADKVGEGYLWTSFTDNPHFSREPVGIVDPYYTL